MTALGQTRSPELAEVIKAAVADGLEGVYVALPGKVEKYDAATQKADVKPLLKRNVVARDGSETVEALPVIPDVPICFPRGGGFFLSFPLQKGDNVLLIFCDRSIDNYAYSTGAVDVDPVDLRSHDLTDAVAFPGFYPFTKPIKSLVGSGAAFGDETGAQVRAKGTTIEITSNGLPASIGGFVALANLVLAELTSIATALTTHVHAGVTVGVGSTGVAAPVYIPGAVASSNLKAD